MLKPLHFQINPDSGVPVYRQIMEQIKYCVASGLLKPGDQLPSIRELSQQLLINPTTVVKSYTELQHESVLEMRHGKGAFVSGSSVRMTDREREKALRRIARQLVVEAIQMGADADLVLRVVQQEIEDMPDGQSEGPAS
jgi:GntR family transcriptional regulator